MDVEEYVRRGLSDGKDEGTLQKSLADHILSFKHVDPSYASAFARAVIEEVNNSRHLTGDFFTFEPAGVGMGEFGVGSRGKGDFFAHRQIARIIGKTSASVGVDEMDDAGAVCAGGKYIICTVDGMHSRLSDFPFLAGFHVTRATLRDAYVMGAKPVMLFSDIHIADDGDVAKIFDYTAGITTVGEAMDVPLVTGSTLRIGGDMVLGNRLTGCVGAVGVAEHLTARKSTKPGDVPLGVPIQKPVSADLMSLPTCGRRVRSTSICCSQACYTTAVRAAACGWPIAWPGRWGSVTGPGCGVPPATCRRFELDWPDCMTMRGVRRSWPRGPVALPERSS